MEASTPEARRAMHQERARLYAMFQQAPVAIAILRGPQYVVELANPMALRVWGRGDPAEVVGRPVFEALPETVGLGFDALFEGVLTTGKPYVGREVPVRFKQLGGAQIEERYIDFVYELLTRLDGDAAPAIFMVGTDVTESVRMRRRDQARADAERERERRHAEVVEARARLHSTFMQAPVAASVVSGPEFIYELANPRYLEMTGRRDIIGKPIRTVFPELPSDSPVFAMMAAVYQSGVAFQADEYGVLLDRKGNGQPENVYFQFTCQPVRDAAGVVRELITIAVDVTAQVEARRRNEALMAELRLADQRKDEFLATLAHELRNPMAAISTALSLLESAGQDEATAKRYREIARRQMGNLVRMVDDLLDVARITRGKVELRRAMVDLTGVLQSALTAVRPLIEQRRHALTLTVTPGSYRLEADATRLEQVLVNLLQNAAKYTDVGGQISVRLTREPAADGSHAVLRVRDNGQGIPPEMLDKIYDPFTQISPTIDRGAGGIGLGLTLVRRLLELHGGSVSAHSEGPGCGSEFVVRLPLAPPVPEPVAPAAAGLKPAKRSLRVVVVEDSEDARELLTELLTLCGHQVFIACDGAEAVQQILEVRPDVALVDVGLPILDGYEVARRVRAETAGAALFLIALTGYGGEQVTARALEAGFNLHLTKPVDLKTIVSVLDRAPHA